MQRKKKTILFMRFVPFKKIQNLIRFLFVLQVKVSLLLAKVRNNHQTAKYFVKKDGRTATVSPEHKTPPDLPEGDAGWGFYSPLSEGLGEAPA
ncbi:MAG: hypothetical protein IJ176_07155 [Prevotella sp.]|nr:hypothetical protein [Prevotella sp.]